MKLKSFPKSKFSIRDPLQNKIANTYTIPTHYRSITHFNPRLCRLLAYLSTHAKSWRSLSPYELLDVSKTATASEIKMAYFKAAKKSHPDLNPGDKQAQERFQRVAAAYELLRDPERRRRYDSSSSYGWGGETGTNSSSNTSQRQQQQRRQYEQQHHGHQQPWWDDARSQQSSYNASVIFETVMKDYYVIREALSNYAEDIRDEFSYATECAQRGDFSEVMNVLNVNKGLIFGVVVPVALFLRFPALIGAFLSVGGRVAVWMLFVTNRLPMAATWLWRRAVAIAMERNKRRMAKRGERR